MAWVLGVALVGTLWSILFGTHGLAHLLRLRAERQRLGESAARLLAENAQRRDEIARLSSDDDYLEALVRREFRLVRPDEVVYRFAAPRR